MSTWNGQEVEVEIPDSHTICRTKGPAGYPQRLFVPDELVPWDVNFRGYKDRRPDYTAVDVLANYPSGWAQSPDITDVQTKEIRSYMPLFFDWDGYPQNPVGRTGLGPGRGALGKWGANFAADPVVTWYNPEDSKIYMIAIERDDNGGWALPGGMAEMGEPLGRTLRRELGEETGADLDMGSGTLLYAGYVDDWRNTDTAWMETAVVHRHISLAQAQALPLKAGDDARKVSGEPLTREFIAGMYASHPHFVRLALANIAKLQPELSGRIAELIG